MNRTQARVIADIDRLGYAVVEVFDPRGVIPDHAYTIGLQRWGWPELICLSMAPGVGSNLLASAIAELRDRRVTTPEAGMMLTATAQGFICGLAATSDDAVDGWAGLALWLSDHDQQPDSRVTLLQVQWPDLAGRLPDDPQCDPAAVEVQRIEGRR